MINDAYGAKRNRNHNLERALEKELSGKGEKAAIFHLNMKLNPCKQVQSISRALALGLHILPRVMAERITLVKKTVEERVVSETSGDYRKLLVELIKVANAE
eukprot:scaffold8829_cov107-Skeletonema_marinoi.AAC.4